MMNFATDEVVLEQGTSNSCLYRVLQGSVTRFMNYGTDREYLVSICGEGHCFGEYSALSGNPNPYTVVANEDTVILQIPEQDIHNYLAMNPKNSMEVIKSMSRQIAVATKHIELLTQE
jgi:CRP-like cAMP-binding protein